MFKSLFIFIVLYSFQSMAAHRIGGMIFSTSSNQADIDQLISNANSREGGISTSAIGGALEIGFIYAYQFESSVFEISFQPSYFTQEAKGSSSTGSYNYSLSGFTFFPKLRIIPLENEYFKFFLQVGIGYGFLNGKVQEGAMTVKFSGDRFGASGGLGAEFCFTPSHCVRVEGNVRYMPVERNLVDSSSGSAATDAPPSFSQITTGQELEIDGRDFATTFSGLQGGIGYMYTF